jgi:hypothetical protein
MISRMDKRHDDDVEQQACYAMHWYGILCAMTNYGRVHQSTHE